MAGRASPDEAGRMPGAIERFDKRTDPSFPVAVTTRRQYKPSFKSRMDRQSGQGVKRRMVDAFHGW